MVDTTYQYVSESPETAAAKTALMTDARLLPAVDLADYKIAGMQPEQDTASDLVTQGIGAYLPYLTSATGSMTQGAANLAEAGTLMRAADTTGQFAAGQTALTSAGTAAGNMGQYATSAGTGIGNIALGATDIDTAQTMAKNSADQTGFTTAGSSLDYASQAAQNAGPSDFTASGTLLGSGLLRNDAAATQANTAANQPGFGQGILSLQTGADQAKTAANLGAAPTATAAQTNYNPSLTNYQMDPAQQVTAQKVSVNDINAAQMGPAERVKTSSFTDRGTAADYMSPYMQRVVEMQKREAGRQSDIQGQQQAAQAVSAGAFGGGRDAIMRAERERNLAQQMGDIQATGSQAAYQQAMQQFNAEQQARLTAGQSNQQAGLTVGAQNLNAQQQANVQNAANQLQAQGMTAQQALQAALANQQAGLTTGAQNLGANLGVQQLGTQTGLQTSLANLGNQQQTALANQSTQGQYDLARGQMGLAAAQQQQNVGQGQMAAAGQQGQLGLAAAQQQFQAAGYDSNTAMQMAQLQQTQQQQELEQSRTMQGIGSLQGQLASQQGNLAQGAANIYGNLGAQQAGLASLNANVASQQAGILGQQAQAQQATAQGIGNLAAQQFGVGNQLAQGIGSLGTQYGNIGTQQAALGQGAQTMAQTDAANLYNMGAQYQRQDQAVLDANRVNANQDALQNQNKLAFVSDIYKGAPSSQMAMTQQTQAAASPFQQIAGVGTGIIGAAAAANRVF